MSEESNAAPAAAEPTPEAVVNGDASPTMESMDGQSAEMVETELMKQLQQIPIEVIDEVFLGKLDVEGLEEFLGYIHIITLTIKSKAEMAAKWLEVKQKERDTARRAASMNEVDEAAMLALLTKKAAIRNDATLTDEEKAAALAALAPAVVTKPPTQNLEGSHITRDNDQVNPGGEVKAAE